jgi:DNA processing protein
MNSADRTARAALTYLVEPGDPVLGVLLDSYEPAEILTAIRVGLLPSVTSGIARTMLSRALARWRLRLPELPAEQDLIGNARRDGIRLICPDDPEWPTRLNDLGRARPYALWLRGSGDLRFGSVRSVSMVGSRAATGYGAHVAGEMAADLGERGWLIVSGGAYGIDAAAHRGVLLTGGTTIAVLAGGVDSPYPAGHDTLFASIADGGLMVSEWPPGSRPTRYRFLVRNRVIAALTKGTVVVEAGERSGALNTARHAAELARPLMAVPGPVTSAQSAGCHRIIRDWNGSLVTSVADILGLLTPVGEQQPARDELDPDSARVFDAFPARAGAGTSTLARKAGVDVDTVLRCLGKLAGHGYIERCAQGWRRSRNATPPSGAPPDGTPPIGGPGNGTLGR